MLVKDIALRRGYRIMAIMTPFQGEDVVSITTTRSGELQIPFHKEMLYRGVIGSIPPVKAAVGFESSGAGAYGLTYGYALVVQWTRRNATNVKMEVRFLPGVLEGQENTEW